MSWTLDTTHHVKIWFSANPDLWTSQINQLRLVQHRAWHPSHIIHLFGCMEILSPKAQAELGAFCARHNIKYHDIEDLNPNDNIERQLLVFAKKEIKSAMTNDGGCMVTASDILRLFDSILDRGIYSDIDRELDFRKVSPKVSVSDLLLNGYWTNPWSRRSASFNCANDFIAAPPKHELIQGVKKNILQTYTRGMYLDGRLAPLQVKEIFAVRKKLLAEFAATGDAYTWDRYKSIIFKLAGTGCFDKVLGPYLLKRNNFSPYGDVPLYLYDELPYKVKLLGQKERVDSIAADMSWKPGGNPRIMQQEAQMERSATIIQKSWRNYRSYKNLDA